ncbi:MBL fold metallo-hydrolase [Paractinoplanes bogorensis]|uniref:MBL fold metallo-hydrolase n=1 Tax=Paractinoplanes bogorensis TaxID=1610840 RepID=UPI0027E0E43C|nr:MBL fold metallo-hydrolase [Actinoplanes bogorensis]
MLKQVAEGVQVHVSDFLLSNAVVVTGRDGVLLVDPGIQANEMACLAEDLGRSVVAGFSTHPDWDHMLWIPEFGAAPRYATARGAAAAREQLAEPDIKARIKEHLEETGIADQVPLELLGEITGLPVDATTVPWDGPEARILEHQAHAPGHAALFLAESGVLVAGDMLSDVLVPMFDLDAADPIGDYLAALDLLETVEADVVVPGHGNVGEPKGRIEQDRAYVLALRDGRTPDDPRIGPDAEPGWEWVSDVHAGQVQRLQA